MLAKTVRAGLAATLLFPLGGQCVAQHTLKKSAPGNAISDSDLVKTLPGFQNESVEVNGVRLHYVAGGHGSPILLLPGWPETWWAYRKIMPRLAKDHRVLSIDLRGMGSSSRPADGYDKKTMANDIAQLLVKLQYDKAIVVGHDIGAMVAFSLAENHPDQVEKLVMLDSSHPSPAYLSLALLPSPGTFGEKVDDDHPYFWWFAFHQVKGLPEQLLEGRAGLEQEWFFHYMLKDESSITPKDRAVYAAAYSSRDSIRASNAWYQAFDQDIKDYASYQTLSMPVLGVGGPSYTRLKALLDLKAPGSLTVRVAGSGHFIAEEKPLELLGFLDKFLKP
ncbi:alpha/beta fold hydrolase [Granulicella sibirica]|uniref:Putative hydrolase n=1 Tax=Granulicella sibirica TaxID=2479048 RepID=A0A4Q0T1G7_9BACT|nr:alpha/beta hydrolase [Granulicella sibirica]RXH55381.1 putative hydrolase [Granulicella sibirica]